MHLIISIIIIAILIVEPSVTGDVCSGICKCSEDLTIVNCDSKHWTDLNNTEFPSNVVTLTLINNQLKFDTINDRSKIENLPRLTDLSLNANPLGTIPSFNDSKIRSLSLQDTSLTSAKFPSSYMGSFLQTILLNNNKIRTINVDDFINLKNSQLKKLHIDSASLSIIDQNAFTPLIQLQALSLKNNQLKSCEFLTTFRLLSSIHLDGNQFTSLPQELSTPKDIKTFSFKYNFISTIDELSPLNTWHKMNYTNINIYLSNNSFDCCQSLWFIRFLKTSAYFVPDASLLTCATPSDYAGKQLIKLNPDEMNCGSIIPDKSWWTTTRIIGISVGGIVTVLILITGIIIIIRRRPSRSGYTEIGGQNDALPNAPILTSSDLPFPAYNEDDDSISTYSTATRNTNRSQAPTVSTTVGVSAVDNCHV
ncbi:unnamed protein product [Adineta steineri]|uniref:LRRCT domain-containing protein n=1 Tax=Adineta steineri TaxID=433720 RepID=A0A818HNG5_9BILA|nr:unnamed protein product [Adineta steineri]